MDPLSLAGAAIGLLAPMFKNALEAAGDRLSEAASDSVGALYERIKSKLSGDPYDEQLLEGFKDKPDDSARQQNLETALAAKLEEDDAFREDVARLVEEAGGNVVQASDSGMTAGGSITIDAGGDVTGRDKIGNGGSGRPRG